VRRLPNRLRVHVSTAALLLTIILASSYSYSVSQKPADLKKDIQTVLLLSDHDFKPDETVLLGTLGKLSTVAGPVAVLRADSIALLEVQHLSFIKREEQPHLLRVLLDKSVQDLGAQTVWSVLKDSEGRNITGTGVIIGFVDTGIDVSHPDFSFPNGTTKILYVWDQTTPGRSPAGFDYGFECTSSNIQSETCPEIDSFGHGTHVAGIAASSGRATGNYTGVAPSASIIFVKSGNPVCNGSSWSFDDAHILDGINYIVKKAHQLGRRAVISLSLGGNIGGHDGTDPLEQALDAVVRDGTPIVVAAGNQAQDQIHVHGQLSNQKVVTANIEVKSRTNDLQIDIWHSTQDEITATLVSPDGHNYTTQTPTGGSSTAIGNVTVSTTSTSVGREIYFEIISAIALPTTGWKIAFAGKEIRANGIWDSWVDAVSCSFPPAIFLPGNGYSVDPNDTIGIPGTAHNVVTVGAYITKTTWPGLGGGTYGSTAYHIGQIAPFSSLGPTRDNRTKPEIVAPGMFIASARSTRIPSSSTDPDRFHRVLAGTSMAAPHVAGVIALMLQYAPNLSALQITDILRQSAREDQITGFLPPTGSRTWGFGKADARTAIGFFRVSIVSLSLPSSVTARMLIDNNGLDVTGGSWLDYYFLNGTIHRISMDREASVGSVRYLFSNSNFTVHRTSIEVLKYKVQYYLEVRTLPIVATTEESGWYEANVTISLNSAAFIYSQPRMLGARFVRIGWWTSDLTILSGTAITLNHPMMITTLYVLTYPPEVLEALSVIFSALLLTMWIRRSYVSSRETSDPDLNIEHQKTHDSDIARVYRQHSRQGSCPETAIRNDP
jgi:subtilisin family serine protease